MQRDIIKTTIYVDCKKGRGTLNSLEKFANQSKFEFAIKISKNNYGYNAERKLLNIHFYFVPFLAIGVLKI